MQLQSCELFECDFWQCEIWEYADKEDFLDDTDEDHPWLSKQTGHEKGMVIQLLPFEYVNDNSMEYMKRIYNFAQFIYQPRMDMTPSELDEWLNETILNLKTTHKGMIFERVLYWKIINTRNTTIPRDDEWFENNLETFRQAWKYVEYFRANKDKSNILKKYLNTFPVDCYGKIKEKPKGIVMKTIQEIYSEPDESASDKEHKKYAKYIVSLEKEIKDAGINDLPEYNVTNDIEYIHKTINNLKKPDDYDKFDKNEKEEYEKKFIEFVKQMKNNIDKFVSRDDCQM